MSRAMTRAERLRRLEKNYLAGAYTDEEMAAKVGVQSRATIFKDRKLLQDNGVPFEQVAYGRWRIDKSQYLTALRIDIYETAMLYLMARRAVRQSHQPNPFVQSVLRKLAAMHSHGLMQRLLQTTEFDAAADLQPERTNVLRKIIHCWIEGRKIRIRYSSLQHTEPRVHLVSPYLLEPSLWGEGIYLVGYSETRQKVVAFKITRIEQAADTTQPIIPPEMFDEDAFLRNVWGIWDADREPTQVVLLFRGETVVRRVQETIWHPNQEPLQLRPNGDCIWRTQVAEWREMVPWIRGWGAAVEVLAPSELRAELEADARKLAERYGWQVSR